MSCISFSDLGMICRHFNLNTGEVFELLSSPARAVITRSAGMPKRSVTAVSDSASEASSVVSTEYKFASAKTADFAKEMCSKHDISMDSITATGNGGKITKEDIKKALPAKKRGRKSKSGKVIKPKDPNAPKRPGNAWLLFLNANRSAMVAKHAGAKMPEITKLISVDYKALTDEERKVWTDQYDAAKVQYALAMTAYKASKDDDTASVTSAASSKASKASKASEEVKEQAAPAPKAVKEQAAPKKKKASFKCPKEHKAAVREELKKLPTGKKTNEQKLAALQKVIAAKELAKVEAAKVKEAAAAAAEAEVVFDDDLSDSDDESDDELDEECFEFEWNGAKYWRTPQGCVMEEEDGAVVGRWDDEEQVIQFDD